MHLNTVNSGPVFRKTIFDSVVTSICLLLRLRVLIKFHFLTLPLRGSSNKYKKCCRKNTFLILKCLRKLIFLWVKYLFVISYINIYKNYFDVFCSILLLSCS